MGKLSERGNPFIGELSSFSKAFPTVRRAIVRYTETDFGMDAHDRIHDLASGPRAACSNQRCQRGGYDFEWQVRSMISAGVAAESVEMSCAGDEGSPKGRRPGRGCLMSMKGTISIEFRDIDISAETSKASS